jgi:hypothetical protein
MKPFHLLRSTLFLLIALCFSSLLVKAQGFKKVPLNGFSSVSVTDGIELIITQGDTESAEIIAKEYLVDGVAIQQTGSDITVKWKVLKSKSKKWTNRAAKVYITYKKLNAVTASEGSSIKAENTLKTDHLLALASSGAIINAKIDCEDLQLQTSSGASASLTGTAGVLKLEASSGSLVNAADLVTGTAKVTARSGASVNININRSLEADAGNGSNIRYKGNPELKDYSGPKGGSVKKIN